MFGFLVIVLMGVMVWLLWNISRNTADTLERQSALQYEMVALEKQLDQIVAHLQQKSLPIPTASAESKIPLGVTPAAGASVAGNPVAATPVISDPVEDRPLG